MCLISKSTTHAVLTGHKHARMPMRACSAVHGQCTRAAAVLYIQRYGTRRGLGNAGKNITENHGIIISYPHMEVSRFFRQFFFRLFQGPFLSQNVDYSSTISVPPWPVAAWLRAAGAKQPRH